MPVDAPVTRTERWDVIRGNLSSRTVARRPTDPLTPSERPEPEAIPYGDAARVWARIGLLSFGGPAGQIATMHRILVTELGWVDERRFLDALNFCNLLPGPEAQQLATYLGWRQHGLRGALTAGILFILPGFLVLLALSSLYRGAADRPWIEAIFAGLKPAVLAVVVAAVIRIAGRSLRGPWAVALAIGSFVAIFALGVPFPVVVLGAALVGFGLGDRINDRGNPPPTPRPRAAGALRTATIGLAVWWGPLLAVGALFGADHVLSRQGVFFSQTALVTFGGAYAVLSYVSDRAVHDFGWLTPAEMIDGLALAETTPGPLILVLQFVGFLSGARLGDPVGGWWGGLLGSVVTVWATFAPSFLLVLLGAPYLEWLRSVRRLQAGLAAITAAVVGVVANLGVWFASRVLFHETRPVRLGPIAFEAPVVASADLLAILIAGAAVVALTRFRLGMLHTLLGAGLIGLATQLLR
ncbi:MAG: chromate efflux transporter [Gemmatimonadetes bacterium]|nr:chromate efflux transporter [Gemmatimonadota bacterium]